MSTNRTIIIDNATLSGVERIIGKSKTINLHNINNDILCLEKLLTSILFSDKLIAVDDYKNEYRSSRLKNFNFVDFIKLDDAFYKSISEDAASFAKSMNFSFEGAKPAGDVVKFFEALQIDPQLRWNIWVSSEYLALSYLVNDSKDVSYEKSIDSIFRNEGTDRALVNPVAKIEPSFISKENPNISGIKEFIQSIKSDNPQYSGDDERSALQRILFGYGWAAERSYFYNEVAFSQNAEVQLAPLRDAFCESCLRIDYPSQSINLIEEMKKKANSALCSIVSASGQSQFAMRLPFFTSYIISKTDNPIQAIEMALSMKDNSDFKECRTIFNNLNHLNQSDKMKEVNEALKFVDQSCSNLMRKYSVSTENGQQFSISLGFTGIDFSTSMKLGQLFRSFKNRPFSRVFKNIAQDMINVERLGVLHKKFCSLVKEHPDAIFPKISTTPKFMENKDSSSGRPAKLR
jgi:hypothetical protein